MVLHHTINEPAHCQIASTTAYCCDEDCIACLVMVLDGWIEPTDMKAIDNKTSAKGLSTFWQYRVREAWSFQCQFHRNEIQHYLTHNVRRYSRECSDGRR